MKKLLSILAVPIVLTAQGQPLQLAGKFAQSVCVERGHDFKAAPFFVRESKSYIIDLPDTSYKATVNLKKAFICERCSKDSLVYTITKKVLWARKIKNKSK